MIYEYFTKELELRQTKYFPRSHSQLCGRASLGKVPLSVQCSGPHTAISVQFSHAVVSDSLRPHGLQHSRLPCHSPTLRAYSNSHPSSQWCHPTISSSVIPFSSRLQSFPASGSFLFSSSPSVGWSIGASAISGGDATGIALKENVGLVPDKLIRVQAWAEQRGRRSSLTPGTSRMCIRVHLPMSVGARATIHLFIHSFQSKGFWAHHFLTGICNKS